MPGRLLDCTLADPYANVALEEALFRLMRGPVLRVWENQKSVVIGRAQRAEYETDLPLCRERSIPVVRRFTAGGAVYNGPGNINWSLVRPRDAGGGRRLFDAKGIFAEAGSLVVEALGDCGVEAAFEPPNSVLLTGGKVSGMAAYVSSDGFICHGTLLCDADLGELRSLTTPSAARTERRYTRSRDVKVANCHARKEEFVAGLASALGGAYRSGVLTGEETELAARFVSERYGEEAWNLGDPFD